MAGRLGLDPYDLDPARSGKLLAAAHQIWPSLLDEFSCSICEPQLEASLGWILEGQRQLQLHSSSSTDSTFFCPEISAATLPIPAWSRGYEIARKFRQQQQLSDQEPLAVMPLLQGEQLLPAESNDGDSGLEALVSVTEPMIYASKSWHPRSRKFQNARALFARVSASQSCASPCNAALLTTAHTAWQQMSRAFAAELLVPAAFLRGSLSKEIVRQDEISDIADSLEISTWVVEHQIRNHRLAQIESFVE